MVSVGLKPVIQSNALEQYVIVKKSIDAYDAYKLLAGGAPNDEFDDESLSISVHISKDDSSEQIAKVIAEVFNDSFGNDFSEDDFLKTAMSIKSRLSH